MSTQFQLPPNLPVRITYLDQTMKTYRRFVGFGRDGFRFEEESGDVVVDNRSYLEISVLTSSGWQKVA